MRVVLQTEAAECGLACLAMVADAHGHHVSLSSLRQRFPVSLNGVTFKTLVAIADSIGLSARAVRCDLDELPQLQVPCLLHWNLDHYVVLKSATKTSVVIIDPARGERKLLMGDVSAHFTGAALEVTPAPSFEKKNVIQAVRLGDLWTRIKGFGPFFGQILLLTALLQSLTLLTPLANQFVVDDVIGRGDRELLVAIVVGFGGLLIIQTAIDTLRGFVQLHAGQRMSLQLSGNLLKHALQLPVGYFERRHTGDILSRFGSLAPPQSFLTSGLVGVVLDGFLVIGGDHDLLLAAPFRRRGGELDRDLLRPPGGVSEGAATR